MKKSFLYILLAACFGISLYSCAEDAGVAFNESAQGGDTGIAGSYARFITIGDFLYIVDQTDIQTFSVANPAAPVKINTQTVAAQIESIFHYEGRLFIGSGLGLFIYQIEADGIPSLLSSNVYDYPIVPCDPVVANDQYAYVSLHDQDAEGPCGGWIDINVLKIFDISDIMDPIQIAEYPMSKPKGLGLDGNILFVCDDYDGLKVFDVSDPLNIQLKHHFQGFTAFDVIPLDGLLMCVGTDNIYQFDYSDIENMTEISRIPIQS